MSVALLTVVVMAGWVTLSVLLGRFVGLAIKRLTGDDDFDPLSRWP